MRRSSWIALALLAGCAKSPEVDVPPEGDAGSGAAADTVISFTDETGVPQTCGEGLGCPPSEQCADHPALGESDGETYSLHDLGVLEVAFLCSSVLDHVATSGEANDAGETPNDDLRIVATVPEGARAVVSVGLDGSTYDVLGNLDSTTHTFDLARIEREVIRFVRIAHQSGDAIEIDAVESIQ